MKIETFNKQRIRCYDNGGKTLDRYTVIYLNDPERGLNLYSARGMSTDPYHGIGTMCSAAPGAHLGKRIKLDDMPPACRQVVANDLGATNYQELYNLNQ